VPSVLEDVRRPDGRLPAVPTAGIVEAAHGLVLRSPRLADRQRWFDLLYDDAHLRYGTPSFLKLPENPEKLSTAVDEARERHGLGQPATFTIADTRDPVRLLGTISWRISGHPHMQIADVGYAVHADARGNGVATHALALLARWLTGADNGPGLERVQLDHSVENPASCKVAERAGLAKEGIRRGYLPLRDPDDGVRRHDVCMHGVVAADLPRPRRHRSGTLPIARGRLAVMRREREGVVYHVAFGGGVEAGESVEDAAVRELHEEAGLTAKVSPADLFASLLYTDGWQYYHVVRSWSGAFGPGAGQEYVDLHADNGTYEPVWIDLADPAAQHAEDWRPAEIRRLLQDSAPAGVLPD
jgi:RimJ/RimL family protein N-acetyltransferase/8-oxo-dGTP pyrophosphatase MutT (NUDIX family)